MSCLRPPSSSREDARRAFTLVELLTVVAIVAVLAALLFPVLASAKSRAAVADETGRLRQIYVAVGLYEADHDHRSPAALVDLVPGYLRPESLSHPRDLRQGTRALDWPASPWAQMKPADLRPIHPIELRRWPRPVSYLYLNTWRSHLPRGQTYEQARENPNLGLVVGLGLATCANDEYTEGCQPTVWGRETDPGQPYRNLGDLFLTVKTDGSIAVRRDPKGCLEEFTYSFRFVPCTDTPASPG